MLGEIGTATLVEQPHPRELVEAAWAAQSQVDVFRTVGGNERKALTAFLGRSCTPPRDLICQVMFWQPLPRVLLAGCWRGLGRFWRVLERPRARTLTDQLEILR